jgi:membrane protease YdiL (CAAX protease family)
MSVNQTTPEAKPGRTQLLVASAGCLVFGGISFLGRFVPSAFHLMGLVGLAIPLVWGILTGQWAAMGFTRPNWRRALLWGVAAGATTAAIGLLALKPRSLAPTPLFQLAIAIPFSLLLASPFQEIFFRGWLQSRLQPGFGNWGSLILSNLFFLLWHYLAPFSSTPGWAFPLHTLTGSAATLAAGLIYGYSFQRTRNILAPWLAHALAIIVFALVGAVNFSEVLSGL